MKKSLTLGYLLFDFIVEKMALPTEVKLVGTDSAVDRTVKSRHQ